MEYGFSFYMIQAVLFLGIQIMQVFIFVLFKANT